MSVLSIGAVLLSMCAALLGLGLLAGLLWIVWKLFKGVFWILGRVLHFVGREVGAAVQTAGALVTAGVMIPLALTNLVLLRFSAARHYGRSFVDELKGVLAGLWRLALGNPLRLVGLGSVVERVEQRLPEAIERAPRVRRGRQATFDGYDVVGTLPSGGSGAQLFVARPKAATQQRLLRAGRSVPGEVVIKSFALQAGSTLPQIVRESRALEAASRLGLVCEHQLTNDHFFYVMPYVKGEDLERVTRALHARGTLDELGRFHSGGLWHKDVKPANIIVANGRAHLVDFGLVTPLASAMTLTTHGTEYYRDPEMVRLAMQGVKVHEVDGVRFDLYSAGAVLFTMLENSFPAHGSLSRLTKRAPEALRWIVQRAMADLSSRYASAGEMRADLAALAANPKPFELRPADLPSFTRSEAGPNVAAASFPSPAPRAYEPPRPSTEPFQAPTVPQIPARGRRVVRAFALTAASVVGLFLLSTAFLFGGHARASMEDDFDAVPRAWTRLSQHERALVDFAQGVSEDFPPAEDAASNRGDDESPVLDASHAAPTDREAAGPLGKLPSRGRVLVLEDVTSPVDPRALAALHEKLRQRKFAVVGEEPEQSPEAAAAVELLAAARHALGIGRPEEAATQTALQRFLDQSPDLAALILVSRTDDGTEQVYHVFVRTEAHGRTQGG
jgi:hypothetical protein